MNWSTPKRPVEHAEEILTRAILDGTFPPGSMLPGERDLAAQMGITRPTLREVLRLMEADGWLDVQQGKATRVKNIWQEGGLNVLSAIVRYSDKLPPNFVENLLKVRLELAPAYTRDAVQNDAHAVVELLENAARLDDTPQAYAAYDWGVHHGLTVASGNPIYTLILNGFAGFYGEMARIYFMTAEAREASRFYYAELLDAAREHDSDAARHITMLIMHRSIEIWQRVTEAQTT